MSGYIGLYKIALLICASILIRLERLIAFISNQRLLVAVDYSEAYGSSLELNSSLATISQSSQEAYILGRYLSLIHSLY